MENEVSLSGGVVVTSSDKSTQDHSRRLYALAGLLAAGLALAVSELVAGLLFSAPSLILAIGEHTIDLTPGAVERWAIQTLGTNDKPALIIGIVTVSLIFGAVLGLIARRRPTLANLGFVLFGLLGFAAGTTVPLSSTVLVAGGAAAAAIAGIAALSALVRTLSSCRSLSTANDGRRAFLAGSAAVVAFTIGSAALGRWLANRARIAIANREEVSLPPADESIPDPTASQTLQTEGLTPYITPNDDFYRIDTALSVPAVDLDNWMLSISGMVDRPYSVTYDQLLTLPMVERHITIACVSNRVGGSLIGNAKWLGVPLRMLLEEAGVRDGGDQVVGRSVDEFEVGFPTSAVFDGREALVAVAMNGEPLPFEHGFPARLVVSGLYGYVSATKWLSEIELTGWDDFDGYWIPRGWSKLGPIKTHSRIDTPRNTARIDPGPRTIAGVAWAQTRGISRVEVRVNDGAWMDADLPDELSIDTWRQWSLAYDFAPGSSVIEVRATDGTGETQTEEIRPVDPDGATGYHTIKVSA